MPEVIPSASANNPTGNACFHLVIPTLVKYKLKTYIVVSVDPCIVEATLHDKESPPPEQIWSNKATEALPEIGLNITIGKRSENKLLYGKYLLKIFCKSEIIPQFFNKVTAKSIAHTEGKTSLNKDNPSFVPLIKEL